MKRGKQINAWYPFWIDKWLFGSTRHELIVRENDQTIDLRGIFIDLMTLSKKDKGFIRANETTPYPLEQLAGMFCVPLEWLKRTIAICVVAGKLSEPSPGIYYVDSTDAYSLTDRWKREKDREEYPPPAFLKCPDKFSSMATAKGLIRASRLMLAVAIGAPLPEGSEAHHINGKEYDDRFENLMLFASHQDHKRFESGYEIKPIWDGSKLDENDIKRLNAEISAYTTEKTDSILNRNTNENEKEKKEKPDSFEDEFKLFWEAYGLKVAKEDAFNAYKALRRSGVEMKDIAKAVNGYHDFLKIKKQEGFEQAQMYPATFLRKNKWRDYVGIVYKPKL